MGKIKLRNIMLCVILLTLLCGLSLTVTYGFNPTQVSAADTSIFTFAKTSVTECNVRLTDKTVSRAIVPETAMINGIEYTVTSVVANGFASSTNLEKVRLPKTIKTIGNSAFSNCRKLKSVTIPGVQNLGSSAFATCTSLGYLIIPETIQFISSTILRNTSTQVYVRATQEKVAELKWATNWNGNNSNQNIEYGSSFVPEVEYVPHYSSVATRGIVTDVNNVKYYAVDIDQPFTEDYQNGNVHIPAYYKDVPVKEILPYAFENCNVTSLIVDYSDEPIIIGEGAFSTLTAEYILINREANYLTYDYLGNWVQSTNLFVNTTVQTIILPITLTNIGNSMFQSCSVGDIHFFAPKVSSFTDKEDIEAESEKIKNTFKSTNIVILPETVTSIGEEAFSQIKNIMTIDIPETTTTVNMNAFVDWSEANGQTIIVHYAADDLPVWNESNSTGWHADWVGSYSITPIFTGDYAIDYNLNEGTHTGNPETYTKKSNITFNEPVRTGYTFEGWFEDAEFSGERVYGIQEGTTGTKVYYAKWSANNYTIVYSKNKPENATALVAGSTTASNHTYDLSAVVSQNGYSLLGWSFAGWNTTADGTGTTYIAGASVINLTTVKDGTTELFAQWIANTFSVTYKQNKPYIASNIVQGTMTDGQFNYDTVKALDANDYSLLGWTLTGWNTEPRGTGTDYAAGASVLNLTTIKNDTVELYAQWMANTFTIEYKPNKPIAATGVLQGTMTDGQFQYDTAKELGRNYFIEGWKFKGWNTEQDGSANGVSYWDGQRIIIAPFLPQDKLILYAQWEQLEYSIKYHEFLTGENIITLPNSINIKYESEFVIPGNPNSPSGRTFNGWRYVNTIYKPGQVVSKLHDYDGEIIDFYAEWNANTYLIEYEANKPASATYETMTGSMRESYLGYNQSKALTLNDYSLTNWYFTGWNTNANGTGTAYSDGQEVVNLIDVSSTQFGGTIKLYAQWIRIDYFVQYYKNKPAAASHNVEGTAFTSMHFAGQYSNLTKNTYTLQGWRFTGWNTKADGSGDSYRDEDRIWNLVADNQTGILYAQWTQIYVTVTYNDNRPPNSATTPTGLPSAANFYSDTNKAIGGALTLNGYAFKGYNTKWNGSGANFTSGQIVSTLYELNEELESDNYNYTLTLYAQWEIVQYNLYWLDVNTGETGLMQTYTIEDDLSFTDGKSGGYNWVYYTTNVPLGSTGTRYISCTREVITYTIRVKFSINVPNKPVVYKTYTVSYFDVVYLETPPSLTNYQFNYFYHPGPNGQVFEGINPTLTQLEGTVDGYYDVIMFYTFVGIH